MEVNLTNKQKNRIHMIAIIQKEWAKDVYQEVNKFSLFFQSKWGVSERTLKEMLKVAQFNINNKNDKERA